MRNKSKMKWDIGKLRDTICLKLSTGEVVKDVDFAQIYPQIQRNIIENTNKMFDRNWEADSKIHI